MRVLVSLFPAQGGRGPCSALSLETCTGKRDPERAQQCLPSRPCAPLDAAHQPRNTRCVRQKHRPGTPPPRSGAGLHCGLGASGNPFCPCLTTPGGQHPMNGAPASPSVVSSPLQELCHGRIFSTDRICLAFFFPSAGLPVRPPHAKTTGSSKAVVPAWHSPRCSPQSGHLPLMRNQRPRDRAQSWGLLAVMHTWGGKRLESGPHGQRCRLTRLPEPTDRIGATRTWVPQSREGNQFPLLPYDL